MDAQLVHDVTARLLTESGFTFTTITVGAEPRTNVTRVEINAPQASRLIGWRGETLNALQHLVKSVVRGLAKLEASPFIVLDVDGYRRDQEEKVRRIAEQKIDLVRRTGNRIALSPMSPYFRRIVHLHIADTPAFDDIATDSIGQGDYRQVVLRLKSEKAAVPTGEELSPVMAPDDDLGNLDV
jgi:predicted RNA-binding protein Jag